MSPSSLQVEINIDPDWVGRVDTDGLAKAVVAAARHRGFHQGTVGVRVTDDATIRTINREHLDHDYPTDVISFAYVDQPPTLEGEMVVSVETAHRQSLEIGWNEKNELLLYAVHGTLHIAGMDDAAPDERHQMRLAEQAVLAEIGLTDTESFGADVVHDALERREEPA